MPVTLNFCFMGTPRFLFRMLRPSAPLGAFKRFPQETLMPGGFISPRQIK